MFTSPLTDEVGLEQHRQTKEQQPKRHAGQQGRYGETDIKIYGLGFCSLPVGWEGSLLHHQVSLLDVVHTHEYLSKIV